MWLLLPLVQVQCPVISLLHHTQTVLYVSKPDGIMQEQQPEAALCQQSHLVSSNAGPGSSDNSLVGCAQILICHKHRMQEALHDITAVSPLVLKLSR